MARTRQLKPDFYKDEDLAACSMAARLLFAGLWLLADKSGRLEDRPVRIKTELFPYDAVDADVLLEELSRPKTHGHGAMIVRYVVEGRRFIQISNFERHQHCHPKEPNSTFPPLPAAASRVKQRRAAKSNGDTLSRPSESVPSVPSVPSGSSGSSGSSEVPAPVADAPEPVPIPIGKSWTAEACDDWKERFGGTAPGGRIGKALKPLVMLYGWAHNVRPRWKHYLATAEARFASPQRFAETFGEWDEHAPPRAHAPPSPKAAANHAGMVAMIRGGLKGDGSIVDSGNGALDGQSSGSRAVGGAEEAPRRLLPSGPRSPDRS